LKLLKGHSRVTEENPKQFDMSLVLNSTSSLFVWHLTLFSPQRLVLHPTTEDWSHTDTRHHTAFEQLWWSTTEQKYQQLQPDLLCQGWEYEAETILREIWFKIQVGFYRLVIQDVSRMVDAHCQHGPAFLHSFYRPWLLCEKWYMPFSCPMLFLRNSSKMRPQPMIYIIFIFFKQSSPPKSPVDVIPTG